VVYFVENGVYTEAIDIDAADPDLAWESATVLAFPLSRFMTGTEVVAMTAYDEQGLESVYSNTRSITAASPTPTPEPTPTPGPLTVTGMSSALSSPQRVGTSIQFTMHATGGSGTLEYRWWIQNSAGTWTMVRDFGTSASYTWTPTAAESDARVGVWVRGSGNPEAVHYYSIPFVVNDPVAPGPLTVTGMSSALSSPQTVGTPIRFTTHAAGGSGTLEYRWWIQNSAGTWTMVRDFGTSASYTWTPTTVESAARVGVWVRASNNPTAVQYYSIPFAVSAAPAAAPLIVTGISSALSSPQRVGTSIQFTTHAAGGAGTLEYRWWIQNSAGTWTMVRDFGTSASYTWTPTTVESAARVGVWVRGSGNPEAVHYYSIPFVVR
jgi:hypothetical protein